MKVTAHVRHVPSRAAFRPGAYEGFILDTNDVRLGTSRDHATWSSAARAAVHLGERRGHVVSNRELILEVALSRDLRLLPGEPS